MPTDYVMELLCWDPTDGADPPRTLDDVSALLHERAGSDNTWQFVSTRSWLTRVLHDLCRATGSDCPEVLWSFDPIVLTTPDLHRAARALDSIIARLGDQETSAVLTGPDARPDLQGLDQTLLARLQPERDWLDGTDHPAGDGGHVPPLTPGGGRRRPAATVLARRRQLVVNAFSRDVRGSRAVTPSFDLTTTGVAVRA